jgi:hypothetical protein
LRRLARFTCPLLWVAFFCPVYLGTGLAQHKTAAGTEHEASYTYETPGIQLRGTLIEREVYGPPGYGETPARDARGTILVLKLSRGISVEPKANTETSDSANLDPAENVREVQLFISRSQAADARKHLGRVVKVTGDLNESITASQYTKVWMDVKSLDPK